MHFRIHNVIYARLLILFTYLPLYLLVSTWNASRTLAICSGLPFALTTLVAQIHPPTHSHTHFAMPCWFSPFYAPPGIWLLVVFVFPSKPKSLSAFDAAGCGLCLFFLRALCFPIRLLTIKSKIASGILFSQTLKENQAQISAAWPVVLPCPSSHLHPISHLPSVFQSPSSPERYRAALGCARGLIDHTHIIITYWFRLRGQSNFKLKHHQLFMSSSVAFFPHAFFPISVQIPIRRSRELPDRANNYVARGCARAREREWERALCKKLGMAVGC